MGFVRGVKSNNLRNLVLDVFEYRDKLMKILGELEKDFYNCKSYYQSDDGEQMAKMFNSMTAEFKIVTDLVKDYANVLEMVLKKYQASSTTAADIFQTKVIPGVNSPLKIVKIVDNEQK